MREREGLITRIRQIRRVAGAAEDAARVSPPDPDPDQIRALNTRIAHLEQLVQGFQDSVHRESTRQSDRIAELEAQIQPAALGKALSEDARSRGL